MDESLQAARLKLSSWALDPFEMSEADIHDLTVQIFHTHGLVRRFALSPVRLAAFVEAAAAGYRQANPFHNWRHGFLTAVSAWRFVEESALLKAFLKPIELLVRACLEFGVFCVQVVEQPRASTQRTNSPPAKQALYIAAVCHDLGAPCHCASALFSAFAVTRISRFCSHFIVLGVPPHRPHGHHQPVPRERPERPRRAVARQIRPGEPPLRRDVAGARRGAAAHGNARGGEEDSRRKHRVSALAPGGIVRI